VLLRVGDSISAMFLFLVIYDLITNTHYLPTKEILAALSRYGHPLPTYDAVAINELCDFVTLAMTF